MPGMIVVGGISLILGAFAVSAIHPALSETK